MRPGTNAASTGGGARPDATTHHPLYGHEASSGDRRLIAGEWRIPELSVAVICNATTPQHCVLVTTLARVVEDTAAQGSGSPSIIAIGEMVKLRAALMPFAITLVV